MSMSMSKNISRLVSTSNRRSMEGLMASLLLLVLRYQESDRDWDQASS